MFTSDAVRKFIRQTIFFYLCIIVSVQIPTHEFDIGLSFTSFSCFRLKRTHRTADKGLASDDATSQLLSPDDKPDWNHHDIGMTSPATSNGCSFRDQDLREASRINMVRFVCLPACLPDWPVGCSRPQTDRLLASITCELAPSCRRVLPFHFH